MSLRTTLAIAAVSLLLALGCAVAPLFAYVATLATFGLAHVLLELRYVDQRFTPRLGRATVGAIVTLLGATALLRVVAYLPGTRSLPLREMELGAVAMLAAVALAVGLRRGDAMAGVLGAATVCAIAWGLMESPSSTLVVLAVLHNLTPVGFLAERLHGRERRAAMASCAFVFGVVPALIASGVVSALVQRLGSWSPDLTPLDVGTLDLHLGVFVPSPWIDGPSAIDLFSAAAYLQCVHYAVVIGVLPRLGTAHGEAGRSSLVRWPRGAPWARYVVTASVLGCAAFASEFVDARRLYGIASAVHAWSELPVLLLSAGGGISMGRAPRRGSIAPA